MIELENLVKPNILKLQAYSSARDEFSGKEGIFLDANENPFGTLNRYPDPHQLELKQKLAQLKGVKTDNIFIGNGSDEVIDLAFRIFCNPGLEKALTFSPTYGMYGVSAAINNIELIQVPLDQNFQINLEQTTPYFNDLSVKLMFICSPNNPTGNLLNRQDIEFVIKNFKGIVIIDEAYIDFAYVDSLISLTNQYNNLIVSQTFSKAWGLAAARVGVAYGNAAIIKFFNKIKPPYNVSSLNQQAAINALDNYSLYEERLTAILAEKDKLRLELEKIDLIKKIYPSDSNFLLFEVDHANQLYNQLIDHQIIIRNRNSQVKNCLRISVGTSEENDALIKTLKKLS